MACNCKKTAKGAARLLAAAEAAITGNNAVCCDDRKTRKDACNSCPNKTKMGTCSICGCLLAAKIVLKDEQCPIGRWGRLDGKE